MGWKVSSGIVRQYGLEWPKIGVRESFLSPIALLEETREEREKVEELQVEVVEVKEEGTKVDGGSKVSECIVYFFQCIAYSVVYTV